MNTRFVLGLLILVAVAAVLGLWPQLCLDLGVCTPALTPVYGEIGGSKEGLFLDADVQRILKARYRLDVHYTVLGGEDQVCSPSAGGQPRDFVWPGTEIAVERYKQCHAGKASKAVEYVLISPIVFYSWADVTNVLAGQKWVEESGGVYYLDMKSFTPVLTGDGHSWQSLGLKPTGSINIESTDPANSNSGQVWAALLATMLNQGAVPDQDSMRKQLPEVTKYFRRQGFLQKKSIDLFSKFITVGMGDKPMIVGYESLLPDYIYQNKDKITCASLAPVRVIYPVPTVWASHPLIAETDRAVLLQQALMDPEIQKLAWERHGFRAPLGKAPSNLAANCFKVPATIDSTVQLPQVRVMDILLDPLKSGATPASPAATQTGAK